jgi:hypothetical protein
VYSSPEKLDNLAFALYRDGIRLITFRDGLSKDELHDFLSALHEAGDADPYQADLVTILWEKDIKHIGYRAVDAYLESKEKKKIEKLALSCTGEETRPPIGDLISSPEFFVNELGLSPTTNLVDSYRPPESVSETDLRSLIREILDEDDNSLLRSCSEICLEIANDPETDETFNYVVSFLGKICEWHVSAGDFLSACSILSDLQTIAADEHLSDPRRSSIRDTVARLGEGHRLRQIEGYFFKLTEARAEEIFAYLALMEPVAIEPLCHMVADCEEREARYVLCRALSIIANKEPERIRRHMSDPRWYVVRNMVLILGMIGTPAVIPILKTVASHPESRVRKEVARWLGRIGGESGLSVLSDLSNDEQKPVRLAAIASIREIASSKSRRSLENLIWSKTFNKKQLDEKKEILRCYGSLGAGSLGLLKSIVTGEMDHLDDKTRAAAAYGLALIETEEADQILISLVDEADGPVRYAAAEARALRGGDCNME